MSILKFVSWILKKNMVKASSLVMVLIYFLNSATLIAQEERLPIALEVKIKPEPVSIDGSPTVYYELHVTNTGTDTITLKSLQVLDESNGDVLFSVDNNKLKTRLSVPSNGSRILSGERLAIYIEFILKGRRTDINNIIHNIQADVIRNGNKKSFHLHGAPIRVLNKSQLILGPPLREGFWAAVYEPSWQRGHRRVFFTVNEKARIPGRFAIDFIKLNSNGEYAKDDENDIVNWYGYEAEVLAVSDGVVTNIRNDFSESKTLKDHPAYTAKDATGNYISIKIGNDTFAFYEHLKPGSIKVKPGDKVKKGDVIASLGFTGQSTGPHLHFHVANADAPLAAEGIPFVFEQFTTIGLYSDFENFGKEPWTPIRNRKIFKERPAPNSVIKFLD